MASWNWRTYTQAKTDLAAKLDSAKIFWLDAELGIWLTEALRFWNGAAQFYRARAQFQTIAGQTFYDLTSTTDTGNGATNPPALLGYVLTDRDIINQLQYNLLEPITTNWAAGTPAMTEMFTLAEFQNAIERRRDQFLLETGAVLRHSTIAGPAAGANGRVGLVDTVIDVRRAAWKDASTPAVYTTLWQQDEYAANSYRYGWQTTPATPTSYSVVEVPHVGLQLIPPNADIGSVGLITVNATPALDRTTGVLLTVPDDFAWAVRFGALADVLSKDGQGNDPFRAAYGEQRWAEGLMLAKLNATILTASLNGVQVPIQSFRDADAYNAGWQGASGTPTAILNSGNLVALTPTPDAIYSVEMDVISNALVPSVAGDFIQLGREEYAALLSYAAHLAAFKMGGDEFAATIPGYQNLMRLAVDYNARLRAQAADFTVLQDRSQREGRDRPARREAA